MDKNKNPYLNLSNEELIDFAIEEMDKLKILSYRDNMEEYEKKNKDYKSINNRN